MIKHMIPLKIIQFVRDGNDHEFFVLNSGEIWDRVRLDGVWQEIRFYQGVSGEYSEKVIEKKSAKKKNG